jgi:hypothetical protein
MLLPMLVFASGDDILVPIFAIIAGIIFFLIIIVFTVKLNSGKKAFLVMEYICAVFLFLYSIKDLPYYENMIFINWFIITGPPAVTILTFASSK